MLCVDSLRESERESNMEQLKQTLVEVYRDPKRSVEARVADLLSRMTLDQKIAQMTQIERRVATPLSIRDHSIGISFVFTTNLCLIL